MRRTFWLSLVAVVIVLGMVHIFGVPVRGTAQQALRVIGVPTYEAARFVESQIYHGSDIDILPDETRRELNRARSRKLELERLQERIRQLEKELSFVRGTPRQTVTTEIVNHNPDFSRDTIRINAGRGHGLEPGMPVVAQMALIGVVDKVSANTSQVILVTDTTFRALAQVESGAEGVLQGQIGGGLMLRQLPRDPDIRAGDIVSTSGLDGTYPAGILIGAIRSFARAPGEVLTTAQVTPAVASHDIQVVTVIRNP